MLLDNQKMSSYINFESWTADQVADWLRGKDWLPFRELIDFYWQHFRTYHYFGHT